MSCGFDDVRPRNRRSHTRHREAELSLDDSTIQRNIESFNRPYPAEPTLTIALVLPGFSAEDLARLGFRYNSAQSAIQCGCCNFLEQAWQSRELAIYNSHSETHNRFTDLPEESEEYYSESEEDDYNQPPQILMPNERHNTQEGRVETYGGRTEIHGVPISALTAFGFILGSSFENQYFNLVCYRCNEVIIFRDSEKVKLVEHQMGKHLHDYNDWANKNSNR